MKKLVLAIALATVSLVSYAQVYVGGQASFWRDWIDGANSTQVTIAPEAGYVLNDNWAIGTTFGYTYAYNSGAKLNGFKVTPYARYTFAKLGNVNLFVDGGVGFGTYKIEDAGDAQNSFEVGVKPGVAVNLTEKISFVAHVGFLGYRDADDAVSESILGKKGFGFDLDGNALSFGLYYNF